VGRIPDEIIRLVRDRVDIVGLVGRFVTLRPSGRNHKGLCPFHAEKTPSFVVNAERQTFKCFGCDAGGTAITFLMRMENLSFPEAVRELAAEVGIEVPEQAAGERGVAERIYEANALAQALYREALRAPGNPGGAYLVRRGLDAAAAERFGIGWAPDGWEHLARALRERGIPAEVAEQAGLVAERRSGGHYDRLRGRVTFPIRDARGRVLGFGGRAVAEGQEPKYLNTPESPVFRKREAFFGLPDALEPIRRTERAVVVEGYFDRVALARAGVEGALATCGTALGAEHARQLRRRTRRVVLLFDGDEAGQRAMERALEVLLPEGLRVHAAVLPGGMDPDDLLARAGPEALRELVDAAPAALDVAIRRAVSRGCASPADKADAVAGLAKLLALVPAPVERGAWEERLALAVGTEKRHVEAAVRAGRRGADPHAEVPISVRRVSESGERKLRLLARVLLDHPQLAACAPLAEARAFAPGHPLVELAGRLAAQPEGRARELEELASGLSPEARSLLFAIAVDEAPPEGAEAAARALADLERWLREREERDRQRELTERMRRGGDDAAAILREKQRTRELASARWRGPGSDPPLRGVSTR
jgi:DNA primase